MKVNQNVQGWAGGILEGIPYGIADDRRLVSIRTLPAQVPALYELLGVVPGAP